MEPPMHSAPVPTTGAAQKRGADISGVDDFVNEGVVTEGAGFGEKENLALGAPTGGDAGEAFGEGCDFGDAESAPEGEDSVAAHDDYTVGVLFFDLQFGFQGQGIGDGVGVLLRGVRGLDDGDAPFAGADGLAA